jgi:hypothetical protein
MSSLTPAKQASSLQIPTDSKTATQRWMLCDGLPPTAVLQRLPSNNAAESGEASRSTEIKHNMPAEAVVHDVVRALIPAGSMLQQCNVLYGMHVVHVAACTYGYFLTLKLHVFCSPC